MKTGLVYSHQLDAMMYAVEMEMFYGRERSSLIKVLRKLGVKSARFGKQQIHWDPNANNGLGSEVSEP